MKKNKKLIMKKAVLTSLMMGIGLSQFSSMQNVLNVSANNGKLVAVSPTDPAIGAKNNFIFNMNPDVNLIPEISVLSPNGTQYKVVEVANGNVWSNLTESLYLKESHLTGNNSIHDEQEKYKQYAVAFDNIRRDDTIAIKYKNVGSYRGRPINITQVFSNISALQSPLVKDDTPNNFILQYNQNITNGFVYVNASDLSLKYQMTYADSPNAEPVVLNGDAYLGFNSLNGPNATFSPQGVRHGEFVAYTSQPKDMNTYVTKKSVVGKASITDIIKNPANPSLEVYGGTSNAFPDTVGELGFTDGSISFQASGKVHEFTVGSSYNLAWAGLSAATLFQTLPDKPSKTVSDSDETNVKSNTLTVDDSLNQGVEYAISQKMGVLGNDILEQYKSFEFEDDLNEMLDLDTVHVFDSKGTDLTKTFTQSVNGQKVVLKANKEFLSNLKLYDGRNIIFKVKAKVNKGKLITDTFENTAKIKINNNVQETDVVKTKVTPKPLKISKKVDKTEAKVNDVIEYKIEVSNDVNLPVKGHVTDDLKQLVHADYEAGSMMVDGKPVTDSKDTDNAEVKDNVLHVDLGTMKSNEKHIISFKAKVKDNTGGKKIVNTAKVNDTPSNPVETKIPKIGEVAITKKVNKTEAKVGEEIIYNLEVENKSNTSEQGQVTDDLKQLVHADYEAGSIMVDGKPVTDLKDTDNAEVKDNVLHVDLGTMKSNEKHIISFKAKVKDNTGGKKIVNTAKVNDTPSNPVETKIPKNGEVAITKKVNKTEAKVGEEIIYNLEVENKSNIPEKGQVTDDLKQLVYADYEAGSMMVDGKPVTDSKDTDNAEVKDNVLHVDLGTMKSNEKHIISFKAKVKENTGGNKIVNTAKVNDTPSNTVETNVEKPIEIKNIEKPIIKKIADFLPKTGNEKSDDLLTKIFLSIISLAIFILGYMFGLKKNKSKGEV